MSEPGVSPSAPAPVAIWEDFVDILYAPASVFARRANGRGWIPLLVVTLLLGGLFLANARLLQPIMDAEFQRGMDAAMRANPQITAQQLEQGRAFSRVIAMAGGFVFPPIAIAFMGLTLWLFGKLVEARATLRSTMLVAAYAFFPRVIEALLSGVQGLVLDPSSLDGRYRVTLGVGRFLDPDTVSPMLLAWLGRVDVFTIWVTVLLAIGLSVTGKISRSSAALAAGLVWLAGALPAVLQALRM